MAIPLLVAVFFLPLYEERGYFDNEVDSVTLFDRLTARSIAFSDPGVTFGGPLGDIRSAVRWIQGASYGYAAALLVLLFGGLHGLSEGGNRILTLGFAGCSLFGWLAYLKVSALADVLGQMIREFELDRGGAQVTMEPWILIAATAGILLSEAGLYASRRG